MIMVAKSSKSKIIDREFYSDAISLLRSMLGLKINQVGNVVQFKTGGIVVEFYYVPGMSEDEGGFFKCRIGKVEEYEWSYGSPVQQAIMPTFDEFFALLGNQDQETILFNLDIFQRLFVF